MRQACRPKSAPSQLAQAQRRLATAARGTVLQAASACCRASTTEAVARQRPNSAKTQTTVRADRSCRPSVISIPDSWSDSYQMGNEWLAVVGSARQSPSSPKSPTSPKTQNGTRWDKITGAAFSSKQSPEIRIAGDQWLSVLEHRIELATAAIPGTLEVVCPASQRVNASLASAAEEGYPHGPCFISEANSEPPLSPSSPGPRSCRPGSAARGKRPLSAGAKRPWSSACSAMHFCRRFKPVQAELRQDIAVHGQQRPMLPRLPLEIADDLDSTQSSISSTRGAAVELCEVGGCIGTMECLAWRRPHLRLEVTPTTSPRESFGVGLIPDDYPDDW
mmetsp:Transcript_17152/g.31650  ORF Transcript_17152/g.31650 Transcript_17152/m.31650 type:complete len:334 (+) Transcript_17152:104-1105(+)